MSELEELLKPETKYVVWENYGVEGWSPKCYSDLKTAMEDQKFNSEWVIMKRVTAIVIGGLGNG